MEDNIILERYFDAYNFDFNLNEIIDDEISEFFHKNQGDKIKVTIEYIEA
jgi:hypothetical protein